MSSLPSNNNNNNNNNIEEHVASLHSHALHIDQDLSRDKNNKRQRLEESSPEEKKPRRLSLSPSDIDILQSPETARRLYSKRPANKWFNKIVGPRCKEYSKTSSNMEKQRIVEEILGQVKAEGRRFWKMDGSSEKWVELTKPEVHNFVTSRFRGLRKRSRSGRLDQFLANSSSSSKGKFVGSVATFDIPADSGTCTLSTFSWSEEKRVATKITISRRKKLDPPGEHSDFVLGAQPKMEPSRSEPKQCTRKQDPPALKNEENL